LIAGSTQKELASQKSVELGYRDVLTLGEGGVHGPETRPEGRRTPFRTLLSAGALAQAVNSAASVSVGKNIPQWVNAQSRFRVNRLLPVSQKVASGFAGPQTTPTR
jgi:hypothetical protein